jgi:hypothetical protein
VTQPTPPIPPTSDNPPHTTVPSAAAPRPRKKKRRWLRVLLVLLVLGVALVALLPTLAGLSPVRSFVLSKAQAFVPHGKLEAAGWSLGWFSPIRLHGIKLYDDRGRVVVEADEVKTNLTLLKAARQQFDLSGTVIDAAAHVVVYPDGNTNLQRVLGLDEKKPAEPKATESGAPESKPGTEQKPATETRLPDVNGDITLKLKGDVRLVDAAEATVATVRLLPGSGGTIKIVNINQPIDADLKFLYDTGEATRAASIGVKSKVDAVENNTLNLAQLAATLDMPLRDVDLAAAKPFLALAGQKDVRIGGIASGDINGELKPGQAGSIKGKIAIAGFEAAAPQLKDVYRGDIDVPINVSRVVANGVSRLQIDLGLNTPESALRVTGDVPEPALQKLADKQMPGDRGALGISLNADLKKLATALPNTVHLLPGVAIDSGALVSGITFTLNPDSIQSHVKTDVKLNGSQNGKPIAVEPITFTSDATATRLDNPAAGLRDLALSFTSAFATFQASGKSIATIQGNGQADLAKARQQAAQFIDLGDTQMSGLATFDLSSKSVTSDTLRADLNANINGLKVGLKDQPPIDLVLAKMGLTADVLMDADGTSVQQVKTATATLLAGESERQPLLEAAATLSAVDPAAKRIGSLAVTKAVIPSFQRLQQFIAPFVPALREQKIEIVGGSMNAAIDARDIDLNTQALTLTRLEASLPKLKVLRDGQELFNDTVRFNLAATSAKKGDVTAIDVSKLSLRSALATIEKADAPLHVDLQDNLPRGSGSVTINVDAVQANRLARLFASQQTPQVTAGRFEGTLALASAAGKNATVAFNGALGGLTLAETPVQNETYTVDMNAAVTPAFDHVDAGLRLRGDYVSVIGRDISVRMPSEGVAAHKLVENAAFDIGVKDIAKAQTVLAALGVVLPVQAAGGATVTAGMAAGKVTVDLNASRLVVKNTTGRAFAFDPKKPVTFKLVADIQGDKTIDGLRVTELSGDFDAAQIALAEPIVVSSLSTTPTARGKVVLTGSIDRATPLLAVLQEADKPMPYGGSFKFTQTVAPDGQAIGLKGDGAITDFAVYGDDGKASFRESQVNVVNDLSLDAKQQIATIRALTLDMASSKAATVSVNGSVEQFSTQRLLKNVVVKFDAIGPKLWPVLYALMPPAQKEQFKDTKLTGPIRFDLTANGAYPDKPTWNESIQGVIAYGNVSVAGIQTMGLDVSDFTLPISIVDRGKFITGDMRKRGAARFAKPFTVNNGSGDLGSITLDVGNPNLLLSIGRKQKLLQKVEVNPVLASQLGSLASAFFQDAKEASGQLDVTALECQNVPLMELMNKKATASFVYSVQNLKLDGPVPGVLAQTLKLGGNGLAGEIKDATLTLEKGMAKQDMTLELLRETAPAETRRNRREAASKNETMQFKGGINLASNTFKDYKLILSKGLFPGDTQEKFPNGATVTLNGKVSDMKGILAQAVGQLLIEGYGKDVLDKVLGNDKKEGDEKGGGVGELLDKLSGKKKK